uniref:CCT domain-containing protein n=1 Tax=Rhodosorus marinus TaxID=101924 RepID=A0A6T6M472_9RHOD|mmetsp:Transcript_20884/g.30355  ORF Transcript_20884/g.30355 Transcript_20884/m.30355 type:complete len:109 (+) Transcript_20884:174-500(+)|eukprot:CAMPEP_0184737962 /NCGR_PEP_ID=MMETSP0315-20130426/715_1 /TAXON_ID=101924 /ORGANISM="Rhodosorus marinus, Strain UTEX LB 2760" /LENGTH=108 /DNA_ID=CAMNT_0027205451 /DNA_START=155 /DNA_END=481 /DNA_ORIENTATION=+
MEMTTPEIGSSRKEVYDPVTVEGASMFLNFCSTVAQGARDTSPALSDVSNDDEVQPSTSWSEVRMDALRRYKKKRARRNFKKVIRYECRKQTAINRPRTKGRFVKVEK